MSEKLSQFNRSKYSAEKDINQLLESGKSSDQVEKEARDIISEKLHQYAIDELKEMNLTIDNPAEEIEIIDTEGITEEKIRGNFIKFKEQMENEPRLKFIEELAQEFPKGKFYIVGGSVRDALLGRKAKDIDMVICGIDQNDLEKSLKALGKVDFVGRNFGVYKLWIERKFEDKNINTDDYNQEEVDIALPRVEKSKDTGGRNDFNVETNSDFNIKDDLARRDLTINAIAYDTVNKKLIDLFDGKKDLLKREIKTVGNPEERFNEDYSRILRAIRFAVKLNCRIEENTWKSIKKNSDKITQKNKEGKQITPWETISAEFEKAFTMNPVRTLDLFDQSGILKYILPEVENLKNFDQFREYHSEGNIYKHTRLVLASLPKDSPFSLIFAALLHDIGKAVTYHKDKETGKITFYGHDTKGLGIAEKICDRLKFTKRFKQKIIWLIKNHMKMFQVGKIKKGTKIYKLLMKNYPPELLRLHQADIKGSINNRTFSLYANTVEGLRH